jgi:hypothetical protein
MSERVIVKVKTRERATKWGMRWRSLFRHCATSQKVVGSIGVIGIIHGHEYQEYFLGGKGGQCVGLTTLPPSCADCLEIWEPQPPRTLRACSGIVYLYLHRP